MNLNLPLNLRAIWGRAFVRVVASNREPSWIVFEGLLPVLTVAAYVFVYKAMIPADSADLLRVQERFVGYVIIGGTMVVFWVNVLWSMAAQLYWEKESGNLQLYLSAPMSRMALLGGMALGGMVMTGVRALSTLIAGSLLFGLVVTSVNPLAVVGVFFVTLTALYGMGMMFSSLYLLVGRSGWHLSNLMQEPIFLASGFYFPVSAFPKALGTPGYWVAVGASVIPVTLGLDALRQLLFSPGSGEWFLPPDQEFLILLVLAVGFIFLAHRSLAYMEMLARREGRLTVRQL